MSLQPRRMIMELTDYASFVNSLHGTPRATSIRYSIIGAPFWEEGYMELLSIRVFEDDDTWLMKAWLNKEHVKKSYENPNDWLAGLHGRFDQFRFINHFIPLYSDKRIGFCQYYTCADANEDWYGDIPLAASCSMDYLIGEEAYLGRGFGKMPVGLLVQKVFSL